MPSINFEQTNPFSSNIKDIILASSDDIENGASIIDKSNGLCQFEKIEFVESVFDLEGKYRTDVEYPKKQSKLCGWCEFLGTHCDGK